MKKLKLGRTNIEVSALAMGSDLIGSRIDRETSFRLFDFFSENGGTLIDTANMYACWLPGCKGGESETTIGSWMKERGNRGKWLFPPSWVLTIPDATADYAQRRSSANARRA